MSEEIKHELQAASMNLDIMAKYHKIVRFDGNIEEAMEFTEAYERLANNVQNALDLIIKEEKGE